MRFYSFIISTLLILALLSALASADTDFSFDDFDIYSNNTGINTSFWTKQGTSSITTVYSDVKSNTAPNSLYSSVATTSSIDIRYGKVMTDFNHSADNYAYQFLFYDENVNNTGGGMDGFIIGDRLGYDGTHIRLGLYQGYSQTKYAYYDTDWRTCDIYRQQGWINFTIYRLNSSLYEFYVNGDFCANISKDSVDGNVTTMWVYRNTNGNKVAYYYDDVKVYLREDEAPPVVNDTFFSLQVKDFSSAFILNASAVINGVSYSTTNGTINTPLATNGSLFNVSWVKGDDFYGVQYQSKSFSNVTFSNSTIVSLVSVPKFFVYNLWNNSLLKEDYSLVVRLDGYAFFFHQPFYSDGAAYFPVINDSDYYYKNNSGGTLGSPINYPVVNVRVNSSLGVERILFNDGFGQVYSGNTYNKTFYESYVCLNVSRLFTNELVYNFSVVFLNESTSLNRSFEANVDSGRLACFYPNFNNYSWSAVAGNDFFFNVTESFNVPFVSGGAPAATYLSFVNVSDYRLRIFGYSLLDSAYVSNFSFQLWNTTGSNISFSASYDLVNQTNITLNLSSEIIYFINYSSVDAFADGNDTITPTNYSYDYLIRFFSTNSLNISFFDAFTLRQLNESDGNITVEFSGADDFTSYSDSGSLYVDLLTPSEYTLVFYNDNYRRGRYIVSVANKSYQAIYLYLTSVNDSSLVLLLVKDKFGNNIQSAQITIQRYLNNSWVTEQIVASDWQGRAEGYFILSNVYYNFMVDLNSVRYFGEANSDANKKLIYAEDVSTGISFYLDLLRQSNVVQTVLSSLGVAYNSSFVNQTNNTGYFRFIYDDPANLVHVGCIDVFDGMPLGSSVKICNCSGTSVSSESSTITCSVNASVWGSGLFTMNAYIDGVLVDSYTRRLFSGGDVRPDFGLLGYLLCFVAVVISFLVFINSPSIGLFVGTGVLTLFSVLGLAFKDVTFGVFIVLLVVSYLIGSIKSNSGVGD